MKIDIIATGTDTTVTLHGVGPAVTQLIAKIIGAATMTEEEAAEAASDIEAPPAKITRIEGFAVPPLKDFKFPPAESTTPYEEAREVESVRITDGEYADMSPADILRKDRWRGLVWLLHYLKKPLRPQSRRIISRVCLQWIIDLPERLDKIIDSDVGKMLYLRDISAAGLVPATAIFGANMYGRAIGAWQWYEWQTPEDVREKALEIARIMAESAKKKLEKLEGC